MRRPASLVLCSGGAHGVVPYPFVGSVKTNIDHTESAAGIAGLIKTVLCLTGDQIGASMVGHVGDVDAMQFSHDGRTLATAADDSTVRLWDVATTQPIGVAFARHTDNVRALMFSPNDTTLATAGSTDGIVRLWDVAYLGDPTRRACTLAGRDFTRDEWREYVPPGPAYRTLCAS